MAGSHGSHKSMTLVCRTLSRNQSCAVLVYSYSLSTRVGCSWIGQSCISSTRCLLFTWHILTLTAPSNQMAGWRQHDYGKALQVQKQNDPRVQHFSLWCGDLATYRMYVIFPNKVTSIYRNCWNVAETFFDDKTLVKVEKFSGLEPSNSAS